MAPDSMLGGLPPAAGIAAVRLRSLGDTLLMTPALAALKRWRGDLRLAAVVEQRWGAVLADNPDLDRVIEVAPGAAGKLAAVRALRAWGPTLAVSLHGGSTAAWMTRASGARWRAGFAGNRHGWAHNLLSPPAAPPPGRPRQHTVEQVASLFHWLGLPATPLGGLRIFPDPAARAGMRQRLAATGIEGEFAFFSARPRSVTMQWPAERFRKLAQWLWAEYRLAAVLATPETAIAAGLPAGSVAIVDGLSTGELIALEAESRIVIGNDGGPIHIGAALGKPTVAIFSATDSVVWAPWQAPSRVVQNAWPCNPCPADRCYEFDRPRCIESVTLAQVAQAVRGLLETGV